MSAATTAPVESKRGPRSIDELIATASASRLSTWSQCRLKFFFRYILGLRKPKSPSLHVGSSVHAVLKFWNKARWKNEKSSLKQLHDVYSSSWSGEQKKEPVKWENGEEDHERKAGWRLLETYFRESPIQPDEKPEAVEVTVEADLSQHGLPKVIGIIDLVRPGVSIGSGGRIVDTKSSGKTPDPEQVGHLNEIQTTSYSVLYRASTSKIESGIELHHLVKTKNPKLIVSEFPPATENQKTRLFRHLDSYVSGLQRKDWIPSPGFLCASCEFYNECRAWH
jgi:putative RecB family exonuclease